MSPPELVRPKQPIAIRPEYTSTSATSLHIKQGNISGSDFTISRGDGSGTLPSTQQPLLFTCQGKHLSLSQRRTFLDASGLPLVDLYRKKLSNAWYMELRSGSLPFGAAAAGSGASG